ncbi:MAG TPA: hypothetical protein VN833_32230 [Candidatus Acidoferrales bacterium]|nr:hypothetical protein [Candidatus Acidoferrales bacterium]
MAMEKAPTGPLPRVSATVKIAKRRKKAQHFVSTTTVEADVSHSS